MNRDTEIQYIYIYVFLVSCCFIHTGYLKVFNLHLYILYIQLHKLLIYDISHYPDIVEVTIYHDTASLQITSESALTENPCSW